MDGSEPSDRSLLLVAVCHGDTGRAGEAWQQLERRHGGPDATVAWMQLGGEQRLMPLLGSRGHQLGLHQRVEEVCQIATAQAWGLNERLLEAIDGALGALREAGIDVLAFKGLGLLGDVYPEHRFRPLGDADLLVRDEQLKRALGVLRSGGWSAPPGTMWKYRAGGTGVNLDNGTGVSIDLHRRASPNLSDRRGQAPATWSGTEALPPGHPLVDSGLRRPGAVQHALVLAAHIARPSNTAVVHPVADLHRLFTTRPDLQTPAAGAALLAAIRHEFVALRLRPVLADLQALLATPLPLDPRTITPTDDRARRVEERAMAAEARLLHVHRPGLRAAAERVADYSYTRSVGDPWPTRLAVTVGVVLRIVASRRWSIRRSAAGPRQPRGR